MARRVRNYRAEYARRNAFAAERGLSRSQARGHPRRGETGIAALKRLGTILPGRDRTLEQYYAVVADLREEGWSLRQAAAVEDISPRAVWRLNAEHGLIGKQYRITPRGHLVFDRYTFPDPFRMHLLTSDGGFHPQVPLDEKYISLVAHYWNAVDKAMQGDAQALRDLQAFAHRPIYDVEGHRYQLQVDLNALFRFFDSMTDQERADFNRTFYTGREVVYGAA
jgi:hypothetical protein